MDILKIAQTFIVIDTPSIPVEFTFLPPPMLYWVAVWETFHTPHRQHSPWTTWSLYTCAPLWTVFVYWCPPQGTPSRWAPGCRSTHGVLCPTKPPPLACNSVHNKIMSSMIQLVLKITKSKINICKILFKKDYGYWPNSKYSTWICILHHQITITYTCTKIHYEIFWDIMGK